MAASSIPDAEFLALQEALAGRFSLERVIGRGGMGVVYLAQDVSLDRRVALKLLPPALAARPRLREAFVQEARTAARLSHPHIVPIHRVDEVGDFVYFVMAFVEGQTLGQRVRERGPLPPREAARILREVAWALDYAHGQGVIHRDVKPDNILLESGSGRALVTDFGIAHAAAVTGPAPTSEIVGTPAYMSPEQAGGQEVDARSDLYSLGIVAHYVLSGKLPLEGPTPRATLALHFTQTAPALLSAAPEVPASLALAVDRCVAKDPGARIRSGAELAELLGRALQDRKEVPASIRVFQEQNRESTGVMAVMATLLMMMVAVAFIVSVQGGEPLRDLLPAIVMTGFLSLLPPAMLGVMARRLLKQGYGHDDLVRALRADVEDRRRDLASQAGADSDLDTWAPRLAWLGAGTFALGMLGILSPAVPLWLVEALMFFGMPLTLLGAATAAIRGSLRKSVPGAGWLRFWESPPGEALFSAAGVGLARGEAIGGSYRPTEVAISMAAERLFADLPKPVRRSLGDLPGVLKRLESHADGMRARIQRLDRALVEIERVQGRGDALSVGSAGAERETAGDEVRRARAVAQERLGQVVGVLEGLRLELLRLHAGSGDVAGLTMDLDAARSLAGDVGRMVEGVREVDEMLGLPPGLREPHETPTPA